MDRIERRVARALRLAGCEGRTCLVAYSGGPDSTALLAATVAAAGALRIKPAALWVDHALRPRAELDAERELVEAVCRKLGVPLFANAAAPGEIEERAKATGRGVEAAARDFRYRAFERAASETGATRVLLGHTADDQLETVLMRLFRGAGPGGLRGIPRRRGIYLRPLLSLTKAELSAYVESRNLPFSRDSTNEGRSFLRNRIRAELVPAIAAVFPGWATALAALARKSWLDERTLRALAGAAMASGDAVSDTAVFAEAKTIRDEALPEAASCRREAAESALPAVRLRIFQRLIDEALGGGAELSFKSVEARLSGPLEPGARIAGPGYSIVVDGAVVRAEPAAAFPRREPRRGFCLILKSTAAIPDGPPPSVSGSLPIAYWSDDPTGIRSDAFSFPCVIRSRKPGDSLKTRGGTVRLDRLLPELGVPPVLRDDVPILEDRDGIAAVLASDAGSRDRFRERAALDKAAPARYLKVRFRRA